MLGCCAEVHNSKGNESEHKRGTENEGGTKSLLFFTIEYMLYTLIKRNIPKRMENNKRSNNKKKKQLGIKF